MYQCASIIIFHINILKVVVRIEIVLFLLQKKIVYILPAVERVAQFRMEES